MIEKSDLRAAVASGLISERQATGLSQLAHTRRGARSNLSPGDEPFELFNGFNEIFIVVGLLILAMGWTGAVALSFASGIVDVQGRAIWLGFAGGAILWLLAEYFSRRRRMVAPSIALAALFAGNALAAFAAGTTQPFMIAQGDYSSLAGAILMATAALFAFWLRFRVPFALALIALGGFAAAIVSAATQAGRPIDARELFLLSADGPFAWITLVLGLVVFAVAMAFDMSDPHRVTRRASNGFWLHLVAAPALVNTVALTLLNRGAGSDTFYLSLLLAVFALVAIVIDRRSFLIAAIGYVVALSAALFEESGAPYIVLSLGVALLLLGAFWERVRAALLRILPGLPTDRLPPAHTPEGLT